MPDRRLVVPHFREPTAQEAAWAPTILRSHSERGHWLHGVREEIEFVDEVTIRRVLSLQLEIPERDPIEGAEADAHLVPLLVFRKLDMPGQRVRVDGREAPLLRRRQNAPMAYAVLRALIDREVPATNPSDALARKLWELCHQAENPALATFSRLADVSAPGDIPIVASYPVLQLARDLAANFLVIVPITGASGSMHLVELEYRAALRRLGPAGRTVRMPWMAFGGSVVIEADAVGNLAGGGPVKTFWRRGVAFAVAGGPGARTWRAVTGRNGKAHVHVPSGSYEITELDAIRPSRRQVTADGYRRVVRFTTDLASATLQGQLRYGLLERLFHWAAIRAPQIEFPLPQIAHDLSYHIELTAPAETFISRADVLAAPGSKMASNAPWHDQVAGHLRQAHLHLDGIRRESTPHVIVRLRSEPSALLTSAAFAAVLALVVLAIVARVWDRAVGQIGPLVTLILLAPGAASAWAARGAEHGLATRLLRGPRLMMLALVTLSVVSAATILIGQRWTYHATSSGARSLYPDEQWRYIPHVLWTAAAIAALVSVAVIFAWWRTTHPPEARRSIGDHVTSMRPRDILEGT